MPIGPVLDGIAIIAFTALLIGVATSDVRCYLIPNRIRLAFPSFCGWPPRLSAVGPKIKNFEPSQYKTAGNKPDLSRFIPHGVGITFGGLLIAVQFLNAAITGWSA